MNTIDNHLEYKDLIDILISKLDITRRVINKCVISAYKLGDWDLLNRASKLHDIKFRPEDKIKYLNLLQLPTSSELEIIRIVEILERYS